MRESAGIDNDEADGVLLGRLNLSRQFVFGIALCRDEFMALCCRQLLKLLLNVMQSRATIDGRLSGPQKIQIRTIQQQNPGHSASVPSAIAQQRSAIITRNGREKASFGGERRRKALILVVSPPAAAGLRRCVCALRKAGPAPR